MKDYFYLEKINGALRIGDRLKEINPSYELCYNKKNVEIEVYIKNNNGLEFAFSSPYGTEVDSRLISYARKTSVIRADKIIEEIEENNKKILENEEKMKLEQKKERLKKIMKGL